MLLDILDILSMIRTRKEGKVLIHWLPDTFRCDWELQWSGRIIKISTKWRCIVGGLEDILNQNSEVCMDVDEFIKEWKSILGVVLTALKDSGYNSRNIVDMDKLLNEYNAIKGNGILYQE